MQVDVAQRKGLYSQGGLAAEPGTSPHGWGLAVDPDLDSQAPWHWGVQADGERALGESESDYIAPDLSNDEREPVLTFSADGRPRDLVARSHTCLVLELESVLTDGTSR